LIELESLLSDNQNTNKENYDSKLKELEQLFYPIANNIYKDQSESQTSKPTVDEVD